MFKLIVIPGTILTLMLTSCATSNDKGIEQTVETPAQQNEELVAQAQPKGMSSTPSKKSTNDAKLEETTKPALAGSYLTLQEYERSKDKYSEFKVVLFFNANWCSTCKIARDNIQSNLKSIPSDLAIVIVDFDNETDLRKRYGVTIQHTFIQIDKNGNELAKWAGSTTAKDIAEKTV